METATMEAIMTQIIPEAIPAPGVWTELERRVLAALETYANVHRGAGYHSMVSTLLFEKARTVVLEWLDLPAADYTVIFATPDRAAALKGTLRAGSFAELSSRELGLPLGMRAIAVRKTALPRGVPFQTGGGTVKLVSPRWAIWADTPERFEAGTPAIINAIAFAVGLLLTREWGADCFQAHPGAARPLQEPWPELSGAALLAKLQGSRVGRELTVPTVDGERPFIYFDNGASTPTFDPIWETVCRTWRRDPELDVELAAEVRQICARFFGAPEESYEVIFTSNTTEALNLAARSLERESPSGTVVVNTLMEHNSNELPWRYLRGVSHIRFDAIDAEGMIDLAALEALLRAYNQEGRHGDARIRVVAVSGASNVLGCYNDLTALAALVHRYEARLLVDGAQLAAHRRVEMAAQGIDYLAFSGHKLYAPFGSGGLIVRRGVLKLEPAERERLQTSGEENRMGIAALGQILLLLQRIGMETVELTERDLTRQALEGLAGMEGVIVFGVRDPQASGFSQKGSVISFCLTGVPHNLASQELAERGGIGVRCGCFCAHLLVKRLLRIPIWRARLADLGLLVVPEFTATVLPGLIRVSFGLESRPEEVVHLLRVLAEIAAAPRSGVDRWLGSNRNGTPWIPVTPVGERMEQSVQARLQLVYGKGACR